MHGPKPGDVLIRETVVGYTVLDAVALYELSGPYSSIARAFVAAKTQISSGHIWRESVDHRGRPLGDPFVLELPPSPLEAVGG